MISNSETGWGGLKKLAHDHTPDSSPTINPVKKKKNNY